MARKFTKNEISAILQVAHKLYVNDNDPDRNVNDYYYLAREVVAVGTQWQNALLDGQYVVDEDGEVLSRIYDEEEVSRMKAHGRDIYDFSDAKYIYDWNWKEN